MEGYMCHCCQYRYKDCNHRHPVPYCKDFVIGKCYSCKYFYGKNGTLTEAETDEWYKRGCETYFPSSLRCSKRKRLSRKRKKQLKKRGLLVS